MSSITQTCPLRPKVYLAAVQGNLSRGALSASVATRNILKATVAPLFTALGIASWRPECLVHGVTPSFPRV
jgi:hypothetical protein